MHVHVRIAQVTLFVLLSDIWLPSSVSSHSRVSDSQSSCMFPSRRIVYFSVAANLLNFFLSASSSMFASSFCPISWGLTAVPLIVFESSPSPNPPSSGWRCLSLHPFLCPPRASSHYLNLAHITLSTAKNATQLDLAPFAHPR